MKNNKKIKKRQQSKEKNTKSNIPSKSSSINKKVLLIAKFTLIAAIVAILVPIIINHFNYIDLVKDVNKKAEEANALSKRGLFTDAVDLCKTTELKIDANYEPELYGKLKNIEGNSYYSLSLLSDKEINLKRAISLYKEGIKYLTAKNTPFWYAQNNNGLGTAFSSLAEIRLSSVYNDSAINTYKEALRAISKEQFEDLYYAINGNLGISLIQIADYASDTSVQIPSLEEGIRLIDMGLDSFSSKGDSNYIFMALVNLGNGYLNLSNFRDKKTNLLKAKSMLENAQLYSSCEKSTFDHANLLNNFGLVYLDLAFEVDSISYIQSSISYLKEVLQVFTDTFPELHAMAVYNLGNAYLKYGNLFDRDKVKEDYYHLAIKSYRESIKIKNISAFPLDFANINYNMGMAYFALYLALHRTDLIDSAITCYNDELKIHTLKPPLAEYGETNFQLGVCFRNKAEHTDRYSNLLFAAKYFVEASKGYEGRAKDITMLNYLLGNVYISLFEESKAKMYMFSADSCLLIAQTDRKVNMKATQRRDYIKKLLKLN